MKIALMSVGSRQLQQQSVSYILLTFYKIYPLECRRFLPDETKIYWNYFGHCPHVIKQEEKTYLYNGRLYSIAFYFMAQYKPRTCDVFADVCFLYEMKFSGRE